MESNEICLSMDTKVDIHGKRPESLKYKNWTRCLVKIEAIKCVPSFLRVSFTSLSGDMLLENVELAMEHPHLTVSINVPGVSVSQTVSRTKENTYGLFWRQNRRDCYIHFALDSESGCKRHMKWIKKSIKNLELHRQIFLELRRSSREPGRGVKMAVFVKQLERPCETKAPTALGPLPLIPKSIDEPSAWSSRRASHVSGIYEEIEESAVDGQQPPRVSRRLSRSSIASGIYEEMKPTGANFNAIIEETVECAPPLPPLPPPRKRVNTFESHPAGVFGEIPRSNTNPESEVVTKKKYKSMLDNLFGGVGRSKRAASVSESAVSTAEDVIGKDSGKDPLYENDEMFARRQKKPLKVKAIQQMLKLKRNSFSSPDLSNINLVDTFDEAGETLLLQNSFSTSEDRFPPGESLEQFAIHSLVDDVNQFFGNMENMGSAGDLNVSEKIPNNFNFSACNTSTINLIGASGAAILQVTQKNTIGMDDLTGYCVMAPITTKKGNEDATEAPPILCSKSTSSGYSTGSYCSATSSCTNSTEDNLAEGGKSGVGDSSKAATTTMTTTTTTKEETCIYEKMFGSPDSSAHTSGASGHLYENVSMLSTKKGTATTEPPQLATKLCTSTPTVTEDCLKIVDVAEEDHYQTPRRSIISVDEKIPSYYPNSNDNAKPSRPGASNPTAANFTASATRRQNAPASPCGVRQIIQGKMHRKQQENCYISSPEIILEQRNTAPHLAKGKNWPSQRTPGAQKVSDNLYVVSHGRNKALSKHQPSLDENDALQEKLQRELLQLAALQKIDFRFDDSRSPEIIIPVRRNAADQCLHAKENASHLIERYTNLARSTLAATVSPANENKLRSQRSQHHELSIPRPGSARDVHAPTETHLSGGAKKFTSLPRFKKIDFSPLKMRINSVLQRSQQQQQQQQHDF